MQRDPTGVSWAVCAWAVGVMEGQEPLWEQLCFGAATGLYDSQSFAVNLLICHTHCNGVY